jgi:effector-binding domain-containing protein
MVFPRKTAFAALATLLLGGVSAVAQAPATPPAAPPAQAQPAPPPAAPAPMPPAPNSDPFGEEVTMTAKPIVFMTGSANWDSAFDTLVDSFKSIYGVMEKQGIMPAGPPLTIYTATDDTGFQYQAAVPIAAEPANPPKGDIAVGKSPAGRMLKFVHRGSYDSMDTTYEAITNYLDSKQLEAEDLFVEEYVTDPLKTPEDQLVINVFVPVKGGT